MPTEVSRPIKNIGNNRTFVKAPASFKGPRYIKDKNAPLGRYTYSYLLDGYRKYGRMPKKNEVAHHTEGKRNSTVYESRSKHYSKHGKPFSRSGKGLTTLFKNRSPQRPRGIVKARRI